MKKIPNLLFIIFLLCQSCHNYNLQTAYYHKIDNGYYQKTLFFYHADSSFKMSYWHGGNYNNGVDTIYGKYIMNNNKIELLPDLIEMIEKRSSIIDKEKVKLVFYRGPISSSIIDFPKDSLAQMYLTINDSIIKADEYGAIYYPLKIGESREIKYTIQGVDQYFHIVNEGNICYEITYGVIPNFNKEAYHYKIINSRKIKCNIGYKLYAN